MAKPKCRPGSGHYKHRESRDRRCKIYGAALVKVEVQASPQQIEEKAAFY